VANYKISIEKRISRLALLFSIAKKVRYYRNEAWVDAYANGNIQE